MVDSLIAPRADVSNRVIRLRRVAVVFGSLLLLFGVMDFARTGRGDIATNSWSLDYDINLVAAQRLVQHQDIYDRQGSIETGRTLIAPYMRLAYQDSFRSYIGTPAVALTHVPFLALDHGDGVRLFRVLSLIEMIAAIVIAAWSLAPVARLPAALFGTAAMFWWFPTVKSLAMGQANGIVMLALAGAIWAASRRRWALVGVALGIATVLKLSPVVLIAYLVLRGRRRVAWGAAASAGSALLLAALVGRPSQLFHWIVDVAPSVSKGTLSAFNQSIAGAAARLATPGTKFTSSASLGGWYLLAYVVWAAALVVLWRTRRHRPIDTLELGVVVLVVLLAGPLTWDHYLTWALLPVVLMCDVTRWQRLRIVDAVAVGSGLVVAWWLLYHGVPAPTSAALHADWFLRVSTVQYTFALLLLLGSASWLLARTTGPGPSEGPEEANGARGIALAGALDGR